MASNTSDRTTNLDRPIRFGINWNDRKTTIRAKPKTKMSVVFEAFGKQRNVDHKAFRFFYDGDRINKEQKVADVGIEEGDVITCLTGQLGGF